MDARDVGILAGPEGITLYELSPRSASLEEAFFEPQIRATLGATPQRVTVLATKAAAFTAVILATGTAASFSAFWTGQAMFASKGLDVSISEPGVLRAVFGGALYLAAVGLLGIGLGVILRRTAGAVAALVGLLVLAPLVGGVPSRVVP